MNLQPVKRYNAPTYPTRNGMDTNPELLRAVPRRWAGNAAVLTLLAGIGLLAIPGGLRAADKPAESPVVARVAPLFPQRARLPFSVERGMLRGDAMVTAFLSEEEARTIIAEEAKKAGISFTPDAQVIKDVPMPAMQKGEDGNFVAGTTKLSLSLDGTDPKKQISYEYVSPADITEWQKNGIPADATFDEEPVAQALHDGLTQGIPAGTYAVFYDPMNFSAEKSREQLRQQVKDFITWLKTQGVI